MMRLFHFTCEDHGGAEIREQGVVIPGNQRPGSNGFQWPVSWWTDLADPRAIQLGLDNKALTCDRLEVCFEATSWRSMMRFSEWLEQVEEMIGGRGAVLLRSLTINADPDHWWVAAAPVPVREVRR